MKYTVKKLAKLSGVSVRTLHFYHEIGLLIPAKVGENGYRYYQEEQLLMLQQILFFRELGFPLGDIQKILSSKSFNKIEALKSHKELLQKRVTQTQDLIRTIDKTIAQLKGEKKMKDEEIYKGFDLVKQAEYEEYISDRYGKDALTHSKKLTRNWTKADYDRIKAEFDGLHKEFAEIIRAKRSADSPEAQALTQKHFHFVKQFFKQLTKEVYIGLGQLYCDHPDFRKTFEQHHPDLAEFLAKAMKTYAEQNLQ